MNKQLPGGSADPVPVRFDVAAAVHQDEAEIAAWLFIQTQPIDSPATVAVLLHGGTYDRRYWHPSVPGGDSYSAAAHLARMGFVVLAPDHPGVGDSWRPADVELLTPRVAAKAHHAAVHSAVERLRSGDLCAHIEPIPVERVVGIGHSMGAMLTLLQQSRHRTYDRIACLGWSASELTPRRTPDHFVSNGDWRVIDRNVVTHLFHWEDVPQAVIDADDAAVMATPRTLEDACFVPGVTSESAGAIDVPVFIGLGERDVSPDPYREPTFYGSSRDITLYILARAGHCHNFASGRAQLWTRLGEWALQADDGPQRREKHCGT